MDVINNVDGGYPVIISVAPSIVPLFVVCRCYCVHGYIYNIVQYGKIEERRKRF
jgi:hypothetical protein